MEPTMTPPRSGGPETGPKTDRSASLRVKLLAVLERAASTSAGRAVGWALYQLGYWGEYTGLCAVRWTRETAADLRRVLGRVGRIVGGYIAGAAKGVADEFTAPFRRFAHGMRNIRAHVKEQAQQFGKARAAKEGFAYLWRGTRMYFPLVRRSMAYVVPLVALAVFVYTVRTVMDYQYVLAVEVDGSVVGYVESEAVFDAARSDLQARIATSTSGREWTVTPAYSLSVRSGPVMDETHMTDAILQASGSEIQEATALYVDGAIVAVTTEGDKLEAALEEIKAPYEQPDNENIRVEFVKDVELVDGIYFTDSIVDYSEIDALIHGEEQADVYYTVVKGDTPSGIAKKNDITLNELVALNPDILDSLFVGDQVLVTQSRDYLPVQVVEHKVYTETIPFQTVTTESNDYSWGTMKVVQEGSDGLKQIESDFYYIDGVLQQEVVLNETILQEAVNKEVVKGTRLPDGSVGHVGSGAFSWPVPSSYRLSRGFGGSHYGLDILSYYGAPIYAADSGVVTTSGSGQEHWSYGICVRINHGNGYQTMYAHMSGTAVSRGQYVEKGQLIGFMGSSGRSTGTHLHFEIYVNGVRVNPFNYVG